MGKCLLRNCKESNYFLCFDRDEGKFIRRGTNGENPFWNVIGPELLDISITNFCERECDFCYRASNRHGKFMSLKDYEYIIEQAENIGVLQVALGGGNPNQHPAFIKILELTRKHWIIPSYTTNGQGMSEEIYFATKKYCGAIAVSWYPPYNDAMNVIEKCHEFGIKVNIHFMLNKETINEAIDLLENHHIDILKNTNAIVFLNYKPIHTSSDLNLKFSENIDKFLNSIKKVREFKIGFDSCMISYLAPITEYFIDETVEFCDAGRFSAFISEDLILYPCSFYNDTKKTGIDLNIHSLQAGWQGGTEFTKLREKLSVASKQEYPIELCERCQKYQICHGGCQVFDINRCER